MCIEYCRFYYKIFVAKRVGVNLRLKVDSPYFKFYWWCNAKIGIRIASDYKMKIPVQYEYELKIVDCALPVFFLLCDVPSTEFSCDFNRFSFPVIAGTALQSAGGRSKKRGCANR